MWETIWPVLGAVVATVLTVLGTMFVARRQRSGSIRFSEADDLWAALRGALTEERQMRQEDRAEKAALREENLELQEKNFAQAEALAGIRLAHRDCPDRIDALEAEVAALKADGR